MNQYANDFTETVQTYYNDLKKYKPLSKARERRLLRLCKRGDKKAKDELIESNLKFVFDIAKRYTGRGISIGELIFLIERKILIKVSGLGVTFNLI